eukprot:m.314270 g.314270  ORF g.314270 m.314270 type:complete len:413 (-) comp55417_c0_seq7:24-1262(-)
MSTSASNEHFGGTQARVFVFRQALGLLRHHLVHRNYVGLAQAFKTLLPLHHQLSSRELKLALVVLRRKPRAYNVCVKFYNTLLRMFPAEERELTLECVLFMLKSKKYTEARLKLEQILTNPRFAQDGILNGYAAILYTLNSLTAARERQTILVGDPFASDQSRGDLSRALACMDTAMRFESDCDSFFVWYCKIIEKMKPREQVLSLLQARLNQFPDNPNSYRYMCEFLEKSYPKAKSALLNVTRSLLEMDICNDRGLLLLTAFLAETDEFTAPPLKSQDYGNEILSQLSQRHTHYHEVLLDTALGRAETLSTAAASLRVLVPVWQMLVDVLNKLPSCMVPSTDPTAEQIAPWAGRLDWWCQAFLRERTVGPNPTDLECRFESLRRQCLHLIYGRYVAVREQGSLVPPVLISD